MNEVLEKMRENIIPTICRANSLLTLRLTIKGNEKISSNANKLINLRVGHLLTSVFFMRQFISCDGSRKDKVKFEESENGLQKDSPKGELERTYW